MVCVALVNYVVLKSDIAIILNTPLKNVNINAVIGLNILSK